MRGEAPHRLAVGARRRQQDPPPLLALEPVFAAGDREAGGEPLDVPLPWARQRLVEVVEVEDEAPVGRREGAEVGEVGVAAGLHPQARDRRRRQVGGHHRGGAAEEGERRGRHPPVADRHQLGTRVAAWRSRIATGSARPSPGSQPPWLDRGAPERPAFPTAALSAASMPPPYSPTGRFPTPFVEIGPSAEGQTVAAACSDWLCSAACWPWPRGPGSSAWRGSSTSLAMTRRWIWLVPS